MESSTHKAGPKTSVVVEIPADVRWEKVLALRTVIQAGRYNVSSEHTAGKLIETMLESHRRQPGTNAAFSE